MSEKIIMKAFFLLLILISLPFFGFFLLLSGPFTFYEHLIAKGVSSELVKIEKPKKEVLNLHKKEEFIKTKVDSDKLWEEVNVGQFILPLPKEHPSFIFAPKPLYNRGEISPNFNILDLSYKTYMSFRFVKNEKLSLSLPGDKIFRIPLVRKYILSKSRKEIITDIFNRDILKEKYLKIDYLDYLKAWESGVPLEIAYNIYIIKMREKLIANDVIKFYQIADNHILFELPNFDENSRLTKYRGSIYANSIVYNYEIEVSKDGNLSQMLLTRFLSSIRVVPINQRDESNKYYSYFKSLPYSVRMSNLGMMFLYVAWTHELSNIGFIREMIQFFERDKSQQVLLSSIYSFAKSVAGTNFSTKDKILEEDAKVKLQREIEKEKKREEMELGNFKAEDLEDLSKEEKIKYLLQKGKRYKENQEGVILEN